jgi:AraC family transcriptional regulator
MHDEARAGSPAGRVYGESLSLALAVYLLRRYCQAPPASGRGVPTLSPAHLGRIREYVRANLAGDVSLIELAGQAQLSPRYFAMQFKRAFGVSPHRYVLRERVLEAQRRLASRRMSISEVALSLGFSDQSHFSQAFRRLTGTTPKRFQSTR